ncbi:MAG: hypothetical protein ACUVQ5_05105 [Candidatus Methanomethylicaceae archaeon]
MEFEAERAGVQVVKVNPRGTSKGLSYENPLRDWISACRIKMRGWDSPLSLWRWSLYGSLSKSPQALSLKQEAHIIHERVVHEDKPKIASRPIQTKTLIRKQHRNQ